MQAARGSRAVGSLALLVLVGSCKGAPDYDRSTPEATLESFFTGLNKKRFPEDLPIFLGEQQLKIWRMRCRQPGCAGGTYRIATHGEGNDVRVVLYVDYVIQAENGVPIMKGNNSPVSFEKAGKHWTITNFGRQKRPKPKPKPAQADAAPPSDDAGP